MSTLGEGYRLALGTFTRIPSGQVSTARPVARTALLLAPLAILPTALGVALVGALGHRLGFAPLVTAGVALALLAYWTRAMHLDGLADTVDGLGAGWDRERALQVLRRGDVGPMGAAALALVLLVQAAAMADLFASGWRGALVVAALVVVSRATCALLCADGTVAEPGSSLGRAFVGAVPLALALLLQALGILVVLAATWPVHQILPGPLSAFRLLSVTVLAVIVAAAAATSLRDKASRTFGGVNGDVLGAGVEVSLAVSLVVMTVAW